jgi:hypothetical protein
MGARNDSYQAAARVGAAVSVIHAHGALHSCVVGTLPMVYGGDIIMTTNKTNLSPMVLLLAQPTCT